MDSKLLSGTVEMLIVQVISTGPTYGYEITQQTLERSRGTFELKEGSLYPALHRLERAKLLDSYWVELESGRRRKYYRLTAKGGEALAEKREEWQEFVGAINGVLGVQAHVMA